MLAAGEDAWKAREDGAPGNSALTLVTANGDPASAALAGPMRPTALLDRCPYTRQVLGALGATWGRSRMMRLDPGAQVAAHVDTDYYWRERMRVHVPVITSPNVRFQCGEGEVHMAAGECWIFDTWRRHRVLNQGDAFRVHLVADTVGGARLWDLVTAGRPAGGQAPPAAPGWAPRHIPFDPAADAPTLDFETENLPVVMGPWELRTHIGFLLSEARPHPGLARVQATLGAFARRWHALWSCHGEDEAGWPRYRALLDETRAALAKQHVDEIELRNEVELSRALSSYIFDVALSDRPDAGAFRTDPHDIARFSAETAGAREAKGTAPAAAPAVAPAFLRAAATVPSRDADPAFERPLFIVSPPRSGSTLLFETLVQAPGLYSIGDESHQLIEGVAGLAPAHRDWHSNRLAAADASPEVARALRERFARALRDRDGAPPASTPVRMLEKTPKNALRIPFLRAVFPEARFIYLRRDPREVLASMIEGWQSGNFVMYPGLPGWSGPAWSFLLVPGWQALSGRPVAEIAARQWEAATRVLLDDLADVPADRWIATDYADLVTDPASEIARICHWAGLGWDRELGGALPLSRYTMTAPAPDKWRRHASAIEPQLAGIATTVARSAQAAAR
ncbi:hypothetical protein GCM10028862_17690 [Luteimonas pelagia]